MSDRIELSHGVALQKVSENGNGHVDRFSLKRLLPFLGGRSESKGMVHAGVGGTGGLSSWLFTGTQQLLPRTRKDYAATVGDGLGSSVLAGPLNFLMRTFPEAPPMVQRRKGDQWEEEIEHPLVALLETPNPFYSGEVLWMCTMLDFARGNAYWYKVRNAAGDVIQLWWLPRHLVTPKWPQDGTTFISEYEYRPGPKTISLPVADVAHFRFGMDPRNSRLGLDQLGAILREVGIDDEAANFTGAILENLGIIGLIVAPKEKGQRASTEAVKETKEYLKSMFTGDKRGEPLVQGAPIDVHLLQYQMQNFDVSPIRDVVEERVCAALGLPAAVVGFGTGLQQTKVGATMKEMRQLAWTGGIIPMQRIIASELNRRDRSGQNPGLLAELEARAGKRFPSRFAFDVSKVRALWEDNNEKHTRVREDYKAKLIDRATALRETGRPVKPEDTGVYFSGPTPAESATQEPAKPKPVDADEDNEK